MITLTVRSHRAAFARQEPALVVIRCFLLALMLAGLAPRVQRRSFMEERIVALAPELEAYIAAGMKDFDLPGLAIGIVTGDRLVYAKPPFWVLNRAGFPGGCFV